MGEISALGYVGFEATDLQAWRTIATDVIGLQLSETLADGTLVFRIDAYARRLFVHPGPSDDIRYAGWEVRDPDGLRALRERLVGSGVNVTNGSAEEAGRRGVNEFIKFVDADGAAQEAFYGATVRNDDPFRSPVGGGFISGEQGVGHIVLAAHDGAAQTAFYTKTLGFKLTDTCGLDLPFPPFDGRLTFLRCNPRHHSLALGNFSMGKRLNHLMLEVSSLDDVGLAYQRAKQAGAHIFIDLGRHSNDLMFSFYILTPSGWPIEIGWGALAIKNEATWTVTHHSKPSNWGHAINAPVHAAPPTPVLR